MKLILKEVNTRGLKVYTRGLKVRSCFKKTNTFPAGKNSTKAFSCTTEAKQKHPHLVCTTLQAENRTPVPTPDTPKQPDLQLGIKGNSKKS